MRKKVHSICLFVLLGLFLAATGCEMYSKGAKVYASHRCPECHMIKGKGGAAGPNLTTVGSRRSREFIIQQIKNPKANNPNTNMPSFGNLPEQDINALADYLSRLK